MSNSTRATAKLHPIIHECVQQYGDDVVAGVLMGIICEYLGDFIFVALMKRLVALYEEKGFDRGLN